MCHVKCIISINKISFQSTPSVQLPYLHVHIEGRSGSERALLHSAGARVRASLTAEKYAFEISVALPTCKSRRITYKHTTAPTPPTNSPNKSIKTVFNSVKVTHLAPVALLAGGGAPASPPPPAPTVLLLACTANLLANSHPSCLCVSSNGHRPSLLL